MTIRPAQRGDRLAIEKLLRNVGVFSEPEIGVGLEVLDAYFTLGAESGYWVETAVDVHDAVVGYVCYGPTPATQGTFDLYWIAVDASGQARGIGSRLLRSAEDAIKEKGGRFIVVETSSQPSYEPTRRFYAAHGYTDLARLRDYYKVGDDLVIFGKYLKEA